MITIYVHNSKCRLAGDAKKLKELEELEKIFKVKAKNYFWAPAFRKGHWDGYVRHIKQNMISTGLLPALIEQIKLRKWKYELIDKRDNFKAVTKVTQVGDMELRDYQLDSVTSVLTNRLEGISFQRGILFEATNAGKNLIAAGLHSAYSAKRQTIFAVDDKTIFAQAIKELPELLGDDEVGYISSAKSTPWRKFMIIMVQTVGRRMLQDPKLRAKLASADILIFDEADKLIGRKDAREIMTAAYNAPVKIALTGTAQMSKDKNKNIDQIAYFGPVLHRTTNKDLVDKGHSAVPHITICTGSKKKGQIKYDSFQEAYFELIMRNKSRNKRIWKRVKRFVIDKEISPAVILIQYHEHADHLLKTVPEELRDYNIEVLHGKTKNREGVFKRFEKEKIDVLICSMIIRRGKNLPLIRYLSNAAAGDNQANLLQILGRGLRKKAGIKDAIHIDDWYDNGKYLERHSKHRINWYKQEKFPVKEIYKNGKKRKK